MKANEIQTEFTPNDPLLTAYALGEVDDADQLAAIERALANNPDLEAEVEAIRDTDRRLVQLFATEPKPEVPGYIIESVKPWPQAGPTDKTARPNHRPWFHWLAPTAVVAGLVVLLSLSAIRETEMVLPDFEGASKVLNAPAEHAESNEDLARESLMARVDEFKVDTDAQAPAAQVVTTATAPPAAPADTSAMAAQTPTAAGKSKQLSERGSHSVLEVELARTRTDHARVASSNLALKEGEDLPVRGGAFASGNNESYRTRTEPWNREGYDAIEENEFTSPLVEALSTFSIDVDTASYANVRRLLKEGTVPPPGAVRIEELINYFDYGYDAPAADDKHPLAVHVEGASAPWNSDHQLVRIALQARRMDWEKRPPSNLVFLLDVSGSMESPNKLGLVKEAMSLLVNRLDERDRVAIVVYAGSSGLVLDSTSAGNPEKILEALERLEAGGSTNGGAGIELAYKVARENFLEDGNNRVILCTDGDFNVGTSDRSRLTEMIEEKAAQGVFLTVLGFGMGNYKDDMLETLSNKGNGNYGYIDTEREARKVFVEEAMGTLLTVAKDVKIQVEFNPDRVQAYRLIGYENRRLAAQDFNDDKKDAGEVGAGHSVTALYEIVPHGVEIDLPKIDDLKYSRTSGSPESDELLTVKMRYKEPDADTSTKLEFPLGASSLRDAATDTSESFRFATAVAEFGMLLRNSEFRGLASYPAALARAKKSLGTDPHGHRKEFLTLLRTAMELDTQSPSPPTRD